MHIWFYLVNSPLEREGEEGMNNIDRIFIKKIEPKTVGKKQASNIPTSSQSHGF